MADKGKQPAEEPFENTNPSKKPRLPDLSVLPEDVYGTNSLAVAVSSDSSNDSADEYTAIGQQLHGEIRKLKRRCKDLEHDLYVVHGHVAAERDRRKALEAHIRDLSERFRHLSMAIEGLIQAADRQGTQQLQITIGLVKKTL